MIDEFEKYPLPPPWRFLEAENAFIDDDTGEVSTIHPYQRLLDRRAAEQEVLAIGTNKEQHEKEQSLGSAESKEGKDPKEDGANLREGSSESPLRVGESVSLDLVNCGTETAKERASQQEKGASDETSEPMKATTTKALKQRMKGMKYTDFRCLWKELSLMGETNSYGLTIRYYPDGQTVIKFDGVDGQWFYNKLHGPHGVLDRYDLFVGAKVTVFGRHMTINTAGASTCHWIEEEGSRLMKQQEWLQQRVESVGEVPLVHRAPPPGLNQRPSSKPAGGVNLRQIHNNNTKLLEQLSRLGMSHCIPPPFYTDEHQQDTERNFYTL